MPILPPPSEALKNFVAPSPMAAPQGGGAPQNIVPKTINPGELPPPSDALAQFAQDQLEQDKFGTVGQQAITALEGAGAGGSFGLTHALETGVLGVPAEDIKARERVNPVTSGVSKVVGAGALLYGTGGLSAPAEAVLGAGTVPQLLASGAEGALFGAGNAVSDAALGEPNLTAQKVLSDVGMGFALGTGLGALSKGVEAVLPAATQKLGSALGTLKEFALGTEDNPSVFVRAASLPGSIASGKSPSDWSQAFYQGLKEPDAPTTVRSLTRNLQDLWTSTKEAATKLQEAAPEAEEAEGNVASAKSSRNRALGEDEFQSTYDEPIKNFVRPGAPLSQSAPSHTITWEAIPSKGVSQDFDSAPFELKKEFTDRSADLIRDESGKDLLAEQLGIAQPKANAGTGGYGGEINPNRITGLQTTDPKKAEAYARSLQYIFRQDAVPWFKPHFSAESVPDSVAGVRFTFEKPLDSATEQRFFDTLRGGLHPDAGYTKLNPSQVAVVNFGGADEESFLEALSKLQKESGDELGIQKGQQFRSTGDYGYVHDWKSDPEGKTFPLPNGSQGGSSLSDWLHNRRALSEELLQEYFPKEKVVPSASESALGNFQKSFMKGDTVDPGKVDTFFKRFGKVTEDLRAQHLNDFVDHAQDVSKASENYFGYKAAEDSISSRISQLAQKNKELTNVAQAMAERASNGPGSTALNLVKELGLAGAAKAVGVPNPIVGAALGTVEAYKAISNPYELGANLANTAHKLKILGKISGSVTDQIGQLSQKIFSSNLVAGVPLSALHLASGKDYETKAGRIQELASNPQLLDDHLTKNTEALYEAAPNVSQAIHQSMINAVNFLDSKIPRRNTPQLPLSQPWEPSRLQKTTFERYYDAVNDPLSVLKDVKTGTLSQESLEAMQAVHPELLESFKKTISENINPEKAKDLPYSVKLSLSKILGEPLDNNMLPDAIQKNQIALSLPSMGNQGTQNPNKLARLGGLKEIDFSGRAATETEGLERDKA